VTDHAYSYIEVIAKLKKGVTPIPASAGMTMKKITPNHDKTVILHAMSPLPLRERVRVRGVL
jgi:hypothetical protein